MFFFDNGKVTQDDFTGPRLYHDPGDHGLANGLVWLRRKPVPRLFDIRVRLNEARAGKS